MLHLVDRELVMQTLDFVLSSLKLNNFVDIFSSLLLQIIQQLLFFSGMLLNLCFLSKYLVTECQELSLLHFGFRISILNIMDYKTAIIASGK
jgi:hypothetical protein